MGVSIMIEACDVSHAGPWLGMRQALWPEADVASLSIEVEQLLTEANSRAIALIALADGRPVGFAEASIRSDPVNGCDHSPVGFLEGIYVEPDHRGQGIARTLCVAVEAWIKTWDCHEFASDAFLDNEASHRMYRAMGFKETERVVYFRKVI